MSTRPLSCLESRAYVSSRRVAGRFSPPACLRDLALSRGTLLADPCRAHRKVLHILCRTSVQPYEAGTFQSAYVVISFTKQAPKETLHEEEDEADEEEAWAASLCERRGRATPSHTRVAIEKR